MRLLVLAWDGMGCLFRSRATMHRANPHDELDDDDDLVHLHSTSEQRKEEARQQRMNAEQRRRDQLRDGYDRLQSVLPQAREKLSKVKLIECGMCSHFLVLIAGRSPCCVDLFLVIYFFWSRVVDAAMITCDSMRDSHVL